MFKSIQYFNEKSVPVFEKLEDEFIKNPSEIVSVGDIVKVKVIKIDMERQKVGLSMKV